MVTKNISLTEEAYNTLRAKKRKNESFSQVVKRITKKEGSILELAGTWKDISEKETKRVEKKILEMRKGSRLKELYKIE